MMDAEVYSFALKSTIKEIQNLCPDVTSIIIFTEDKELTVGDETASGKNLEEALDAIDGLLHEADAIGGIKGITLEGAEGRLNVTHINDFYLLMATSKKADANYINTVTRVLIPTIINLLKKICPTPIKTPLPTETKPKTLTVQKTMAPTSEPPIETIREETEETVEPEKLHPEPPINQLIVENLSGLMIPSDTVRIDSEILSKWEKICEGKKVETVTIETFNGKTLQCKVKPIKDQKYEGKGIIQIPEKLQQTLEIKKGELVKAKPIT